MTERPLFLVVAMLLLFNGRGSRTEVARACISDVKTQMFHRSR
jgi:hypothetical protein